jgi:hypothetical protein
MNAAELLTDEFFEQVLIDIKRSLPPRTSVMSPDAENFSMQLAYRQRLRAAILERLGAGEQ